MGSDNKVQVFAARSPKDVLLYSDTHPVAGQYGYSPNMGFGGIVGEMRSDWYKYTPIATNRPDLAKKYNLLKLTQDTADEIIRADESRVWIKGYIDYSEREDKDKGLLAPGTIVPLADENGFLSIYFKIE